MSICSDIYRKGELVVSTYSVPFALQKSKRFSDSLCVCGEDALQLFAKVVEAFRILRRICLERDCPCFLKFSFLTCSREAAV